MININSNVREGIILITDILIQIFNFDLFIGITFGQLVVGCVFLPVIYKILKTIFSELIVQDNIQGKERGRKP